MSAAGDGDGDGSSQQAWKSAAGYAYWAGRLSASLEAVIEYPDETNTDVASATLAEWRDFKEARLSELVGVCARQEVET